MFIIFIRAIVIFLTLLVIMRLMGKRQIGEMQPFELIITLVIADLACIPMADTSIPLMYGVVAITALFILHQLVTILDQNSQGFKHLVSGKPTVVINRNGVDFKELKKNNLDLSDLIEAMRSNGYFALDDLEYAIFEANGKFSALEKSEREIGEPSLPLLIISDGKIDRKNLELAHFENSYIEGILQKQGVAKLKKVEAMTIDSNGKVYLQKAGERYTTFFVELPEDCEW